MLAVACDTDGPDADPEPATFGACTEVDPAVSAAFALDLAAWPIDPESFYVDVACTVGAVTSAGGSVTTELACTLDGAPQTTTLTHAASPVGPVAWATGDAVQLTARTGAESTENASWREVQLRAAADDALLLSAEASALSDGVYNHFQPLKLALVSACAENPEMFASQAMRVDLTPPDGPQVRIFHGNRGELPIDADTSYAIDVAAALGDDTHPDEDIQILLRRVKTGA